MLRTVSSGRGPLLREGDRPTGQVTRLKSRKLLLQVAEGFTAISQSIYLSALHHSCSSPSKVTYVVLRLLGGHRRTTRSLGRAFCSTAFLSPVLSVGGRCSPSRPSSPFPISLPRGLALAPCGHQCRPPSSLVSRGHQSKAGQSSYTCHWSQTEGKLFKNAPSPLLSPGLARAFSQEDRNSACIAQFGLLVDGS